MATGDLTTLANAKAWLNIATATDDAIIARMVSSVSMYIQSWLNRSFAIASYTDKFSGNGVGTQQAFGNYPVVSVSAVAINGVAVPLSVDGIAPGYQFDTRGLYLIGYTFAAGVRNVSVTYSAGYATTPPEIEQAAVELIALRYRERSRVGEVSKSIGGEVVSYSQKAMPEGVKVILNNYRRVTPGY